MKNILHTVLEKAVGVGGVTKIEKEDSDHKRGLMTLIQLG